MSRWRQWLGFVVMMLVALVVAHNLVFILAYGAGYDEALAHSGHDGAWGTAVAGVLAAGVGLLVLGTWRLYRLGLVARALGPTEGRLAPGASGFARGLARLWLALAGATATLFVIQENLEHLRAGEGLPGLSVLGSAEYPRSALVIAGVALAVALVGALFRWRRDLLIARIAAALRRRHLRPVPTVRRPVVSRDRRPETLVGRSLAARAPPAIAAR